MLYIGLLLIALWIWLSFRNGTLSSIIGSVSLMVGALIVFITDRRVGIILVFIACVVYLIGLFVGSDKKKIGRILKVYSDGKRLHPDMDEDAMCRGILIARLASIKHGGIRDESDATYWITKVYEDKKFTVEDLCATIVSLENPGKFSFNKSQNWETYTKNKEALKDMIIQAKEQYLK